MERSYLGLGRLVSLKRLNDLVVRRKAVEIIDDVTVRAPWNHKLESGFGVNSGDAGKLLAWATPEGEVFASFWPTTKWLELEYDNEEAFFDEWEIDAADLGDKGRSDQRTSEELVDGHFGAKREYDQGGNVKVTPGNVGHLIARVKQDGSIAAEFMAIKLSVNLVYKNNEDFYSDWQIEPSGEQESQKESVELVSESFPVVGLKVKAPEDFHLGGDSYIRKGDVGTLEAWRRRNGTVGVEFWTLAGKRLHVVYESVKEFFRVWNLDSQGRPRDSAADSVTEMLDSLRGNR